MIYDPFDEIAKMHEKMDKIFNKLYRGRGGRINDQGSMKELSEIGYRAPVTNMKETENGILANFELPGANKDDIELNVLKDRIEVKVEKKHEENIDNKHVKGFTSNFSRFYRSVPLPTEVDSEHTHATYKNGMLRIEIPKLNVLPDKKKRIDIE